MASGSLGQGLSVAAGSALAKKLNKDTHLIYCLLGDGEMQEGQNWEALMFVAARKVDNLIAVIDYNGKQIDGPLKEVLDLGDLPAKIEAFGWNVFRMNGNDMKDILETFKLAKNNTGKGTPIMIIMKTLMGYGVDFMLDDHNWHGVPPNDEQARHALSQLPETLGDY